MITPSDRAELQRLVRLELDARLRSPILNSQVSPRGMTQGRIAKRVVSTLPGVAQEYDEVHLEESDFVTGWLYRKGSWVQVGESAIVTALPGSPHDGQVIFYEVEAGTVWQLRYNGDSASSYKWEFVGGPPIFDMVAASQSLTNQTSYTDLATAGPSITLPLDGDYQIGVGARSHSGTANQECWMSYELEAGNVAASDTWALDCHTGPAGAFSHTSFHAWREYRHTGIAAGAVNAKYKTQAGSTHYWIERLLKAWPVRVG